MQTDCSHATTRMYNRQSVKIGLICLLAVCSAAMAQLAGPWYPTKIEDAPFMVQIRDDHGRLRCAGTLVSPKHVLTAAHCIHEENLARLVVVAGTGKKLEVGERRRIVKVSIPKEYENSAVHMDIAVIELDNRLERSYSIEPVSLRSEPLDESSFVDVFGWDKDDDDDLRSLNIPLVPHEECARNYANTAFEITDSMVCAADSCFALSGSPALYNGQLFAILVGGKDCGLDEYPSVYTSVAYVRKFIKDVMRN